MSQISQNPDGTYSKTYSETELALIQALEDETVARIQGDQEVWTHITTFQNRLDELEAYHGDLATIQAAITQNMTRLDEYGERIKILEESVIVDAYSKPLMDSYMVEYRIEQLAHVYQTPSNDIFDQANINDLHIGYKHYLHADINEPYGHHIPENTMQRYTINAYASEPRQVKFTIRFSDRLVLYIDNEIQATYIDSGGNFDGAAKVLIIELKEGWTKIQFLIANETQRGGLVVHSDLYENADYLSNLDYMAGMISGDRIMPGAMESHHLSPNMDLVVRTLRATASDVPAVVVGDTNGCGSIQIGDKTITKCKDEPFVFDDGIRVNGYIRVSQLLIDVDFVRAGKGIVIDAIKDAETGFTKMYEIINDMLLINGGGLIIIGNAREGYTITNHLQLVGNPDGGIDVTGDPVNGYVIHNIMELSETGGLLVTGDATHGFFIQNRMVLTASPGLKVEGNAYKEAGYHIKNQMEITADGLIATPTKVNVDAIKSWHLENDTLITTDTEESLHITKEGPGHFVINNTLKIDGNGVRVTPTGSATRGYSRYDIDLSLIANEGVDYIDVQNSPNGTWRISNRGVHQVISTGDGLSVTGTIGGNRGVVTIRNTGVTRINAGNGISTSGSTGSITVSNNGVVGLSGSGIATVSGSPGGHYTVHVPQPPSPPVLSVNGQTGHVWLDIPDIPDPPDPDKELAQWITALQHWNLPPAQSFGYQVNDSAPAEQPKIFAYGVVVPNDQRTITVRATGAGQGSSRAVTLVCRITTNGDSNVLYENTKTVTGSVSSGTDNGQSTSWTYTVDSQYANEPVEIRLLVSGRNASGVNSLAKHGGATMS